MYSRLDRLSSFLGLLTVVAAIGTPPATAQCPSPAAHGARQIPAFFDQDRVLAAPVSASGDTLYFILDSGGG